MLYIINFIFSFVLIMLYVFVYIYIDKLEKTGCECSDEWRRYFIKYSSVILVINLLLRAFNIDISNIHNILGMLFSIFFLVFLIVVLTYIHDLKKKKCECSESDTRNVLQVVSIIQITILITVFIAALLFGSTMIGTMKGSKGVSPRLTKMTKRR